MAYAGSRGGRIVWRAAIRTRPATVGGDPPVRGSSRERCRPMPDRRWGSAQPQASSRWSSWPASRPAPQRRRQRRWAPPRLSHLPGGQRLERGRRGAAGGANSATLLQTIGLATGLHPDFGSYAGYGIPFNTVSGTQPELKVRFGYAVGVRSRPYPIPSRPKIEAGSDRHMLIVDRDHCKLYELWNAAPHVHRAGAPARARSGTWAQTPCAPTAGRAPTPPACRSCPDWCATARWRAGVIDHALRFTAPRTRARPHLPGPPRRRLRHRQPRCRRWACGCG